MKPYLVNERSPVARGDFGLLAQQFQFAQVFELRGFLDEQRPQLLDAGAEIDRP